MIPNVECGRCMFWRHQDRITRPDGLRVGQCRKRAPRVTEDENFRCHASFPLMNEDGWCGEFKADRKVSG